MEGLGTLFIGFQILFSNPFLIVLVFIGVFLGIVFGAIPGLTAALAISLLLPFTFAMAPTQGITLLIAIYVGGISGGLISATLLNIPGTPASIVTTFDGSPMARNGQPGNALLIGTFASLIGGIFSAVCLVIISPVLATFSLKFGSWEYFALGVMGLCIVVGLCSDDVVKGFISAIIGLIIGMIGIDPVSASARFTFGQWQLGAGFDTLAVLMGLFALCEILTQLKTMGKSEYKLIKLDKVPLIPTKGMLKGTWKTMINSSIIGSLVGILPGVGQTTASFLAYTQAKETSKEPEKFGTGCAEGIIASEAANNAVCGGALIPMLTLGIPGDVVTAILLGSLVVHGLQPGPLLFQSSKDFVGIVFVAFILSNIVMYIQQMGLMKAFVQLIKVPLNILSPIIILMCMIGSMAANNRVFDCGVLVLMGIVGYLLINNKFPLPPLVLGYVLSEIVELNFRVAVIASSGSIMPLFKRPIALVLILFGVFMLVLQLVRNNKNRKKGKETILDS